ncbi:TetR family transcriptional regulator [Erythrobacter sp. LQ02-29]|jgi:TetR/AcrR family transcriptional regulator, regulator of cefoperazone and chloramphenicol sensitivity|uniref:TetR/AcrR family transcriptional regulator n=1 Tax=Erythrobacter sp. LQ02-29 TaxID=2920384 RepID=UPI001F4E2F70|nr:TetR family transcriptional regulator [Erythrobacter sp. LQ02-29]MCP9222132.1 TetR family transcriptional regulator [Erythrobacter sp. LQ02-29]
MTQRRGRGRPKHTDSDTGAAIASAALQRFAAQGYEATSLREVAADAGVDVALISYRYGGKTGLWQSIVSQAACDLREALEETLAATSDRPAIERLRHSMKAFLAYLLKRPEVPRLLLRDITIDTERSQWLLDELSLPLHRHFNELAQEAVSDCPATPAHLDFRVANFIYSAASTVARRERLARLVDDIAEEDQFSAALETVLIEGALCDD